MLCERANSDGTRNFACDTDLQAPFRNVGYHMSNQVANVIQKCAGL